MESNKLLSSKQHGFRKDRSCLTHLLKDIDDILQNTLNGDESDVIYLDFAKAFDKVDHEILIQKLKLHGIKGQLLIWIQNFLINRKQSVMVDGHHSTFSFVISGVPQGSVLGPILLLIYINDLQDCLKGSTAGSFADDTRLTKSISSIEDTKTLQEDLAHVVQWSNANNMSLHEDKFEFLSYQSPNSKLLRELPFTSEWLKYNSSTGQTIYPTNIVKDLGVHLSSDFKWSSHVNTIVNSANMMANWVLSVFADRSQTMMLTLYKSLIRSKLEYCCPVWNPSAIGDIQKLESTQRAFTKRIYICKDMSYWDRLKKLGLFSLQRRRERYIIIHMWKMLHGLSPNDIGSEFYENPRLGIKVRIPSIKKSAIPSAKSIYDNSFAVTGPKHWNILPKYITSKGTLDSFKSSLTAFLQNRFPDLPPISGYNPPNSNSLLEWSRQTGGLQQMAP